MEFKLQAFLFPFLTLSSQILFATCDIDLRFKIRFKDLPKECRMLSGDSKGAQCKIPYTMSLLVSPSADFDMKAEMMQDGHLRPLDGHNEFGESTVVRIPSTIQIEQGDHLLVGIKMFSVSNFVQNYFVLDMTKLASGQQESLATTITGDDFSFSSKAKRLFVRKEFSNKICSCQKSTCGCCEHLDIPKIHLNETGCVNVSYLKVNKGIAFSFSLNGVVVYEAEISARNPPPVCFEVPHLKEYASLCVKFHDLDIAKAKFSGCMAVEAELYHIKIYEQELGCFNIPLSYHSRVARSLRLH